MMNYEITVQEMVFLIGEKELEIRALRKRIEELTRQLRGQNHASLQQEKEEEQEKEIG